MMKEDKRFYTVLFAPAAESSSRKFNIPHSVLHAIIYFAPIVLLTVICGAYAIAKLNLMQQENRLLREQNQEAQSRYDVLKSRLTALDSTQRKLAEASGVSHTADINKSIGQGGPDTETNASDIERVTSALESELHQIKDVFDKNQIKLASTPNGWPVRGYITDGFGTRRNPFSNEATEYHAGLDIATNHGTAIEATADGIVMFAGIHGGYGNVVVIDHGYGITTRYGHMSQIDVRLGQHVTRGKQIGTVGSTGRSTAPHCHYEVRLHDRPVNPLSYISVGRS